MGKWPSSDRTSGGGSSSPSSLDGTRSGTGSESALSGPSRQPKGRKKDATVPEIAARGRFCSLTNSSVRAHEGASQGQKKFHANTE
eukprot:4662947-Alexandrium_andersonii.AAC.1